MCRLPAISVSVNGASGAISSVDRLSAVMAMRREAPFVANVRRLSLRSTPSMVRWRVFAFGSAGSSPPMPCQLAVPSALREQPHVGAFEPDAIDHQVPAQQREQLDAELRAAPGGHGFAGKAGRIAEAAFAGAQCQPGKELQFDVTDQRELPAGGLAHRGLDARLEAVGIDQQHQHRDRRAAAAR